MRDAPAPTAVSRPTWTTVVELLDRLVRTQEPLDASSSRRYLVARYDRDWRVLLEGGPSPKWVDIEDIRACWETFERLGRIDRDDVLEPGRCAAFMLALFEELPGVERARDGDATLVLV